MLRKLVLGAVVALVPGFAFAAATGTSAPASTDTHVTGTETKAEAAVKSDAKDSAVKTDVKSDAAVKSDLKDSAVKTDVKSDAAKSKAVDHPARHKAAGKAKTDSKAGKADSSKL